MELHWPSVFHLLFIIISLLHINLIHKFLIHFHYTKCMGLHFTFVTISIFATALKQSSTALFTNFTNFRNVLTLSKIILIDSSIIYIRAVLHYHILRGTQLINVWETKSTNWMYESKRINTLRFFLLLLFCLL